jgi:hypothetical protein
MGPNSAEKVMGGKSYAKGMRAHKLTWQALWRLLLPQIQSCLEAKDPDMAHRLSEAAEMQDVETLTTVLGSTSFLGHVNLFLETKDDDDVNETTRLLKDILDSEWIWEIWKIQEKHVRCIQDPDGVQLYTRTGTLTKGGVEDTLGTPLLDSEQIWEIWKIQEKHVRCIQDLDGVQHNTRTGTLTKGGVQLPMYRCARGSILLESFHLHLARFIPGKYIFKIHDYFH